MIFKKIINMKECYLFINNLTRLLCSYPNLKNAINDTRINTYLICSFVSYFYIRIYIFRIFLSLSTIQTSSRSSIILKSIKEV